MLSSGDWWRKVPSEPRANVAWRLRMYKAAEKDVRIQRGLIEMCANDIFFFANAFVWQSNPLYVGHEIGPMIAYPFQREAVSETLRYLYGIKRGQRNDMVWEKSREVGATWWALIIGDWICQFHKNTNVYAISHSEDAVDRPADPNCLFWKVNFMHEHMPDWLTRGIRKRKLSFEYPATGASFNGGATTERSGVGGRATLVLLDEFSKHKADSEIWGQTANTGPRLVIATHYGISGKFFDLATDPDQIKIVMHWSQHPEFSKGAYRYDRDTNKVEILDKDYVFPPNYKFVVNGTPNGGPFPCLRSPWYDHECLRRKSDRDVAMHLDINPQGSVSQFFSPAPILRLIREHCRPPVWEGLVEFDKTTGDFEKLSRVPGGPLKLWMMPDGRGRLPKGRYALGCDISTGMGVTPSCLMGIDCLRSTQILDFTHANTDEVTLASLAVSLCHLLWDHEGNGALLIWEVPGPGKKFGNTVLGLGYRNVWMREKADIITREITEKVAWVNNNNNSRDLLAEFRDAIISGTLTVHDEVVMRETLAFFVDADGYPKHGKLKTRGDPNEARINHGDHVMACGMAWLAAKPLAVQIKQREETEVKPGTLAWRMQYHDNLRKQRSTSGQLLARGCGRMLGYGTH